MQRRDHYPVGTPGTLWFKTASEFEYFNDAEKTAEARSADGMMSTVGERKPNGFPGEKRYPVGTSTSTNVRLTEAETHAFSMACRTAVGPHR